MENLFFYLRGKYNSGSAFADTKYERPVAHELIPMIKEELELPFKLVLKKINKDGEEEILRACDIEGISGIWKDYQPNTLVWPLMSTKMKNIVESCLTGQEKLVWISVMITCDNEIREYFIPRFTKQLDVLDEKKTLFVKGTKHIIKPVFSLEKVQNYSLFHKSQEHFWEITSGLYISNKLKTELQNAKLTGLDFEKTSVS